MSHTRLRSTRLSRRQVQEPPNPFYSWIGLSVLAVFAIGGVLVIWGSLDGHQRMRQMEHLPTTAGTVTAERVKEDSYVSLWQNRFYRSYVCQCRVEYSITGKAYSVWTNSRRDTDRTALLDCRPECFASTYRVRYDPKQPSDGEAFIPAAGVP